jgi:hypothetical protein
VTGTTSGRRAKDASPTAGRPRIGAAAAVLAGLVAVALATVVGWNEGVLDAIVTPPPIAGAALVGASVGLGALLLLRCLDRLSASGPDDVPGLIRGVRYAFLAIAAIAAAAGWALAHPLPLVVAAVIAGIDVIETSFLLLVVGRR